MKLSKTQPLAQLALMLAVMLGLAGCFNSSKADVNFSLGSVSVGQQLMDLETARSAGLLSDAEHRMIRDKLVAAIASMGRDSDDDDDDDDDESEYRYKDWQRDKQDDDEGFSWF